MRPRPLLRLSWSRSPALERAAGGVTDRGHPQGLRCARARAAEGAERVGCYEGKLNRAWTPSTRRAIRPSRSVSTPPCRSRSLTRSCSPWCKASRRGCGESLAPPARGSARMVAACPTPSSPRRREHVAADRGRARAAGVSAVGREGGCRDHRLVDDHLGGRTCAGRRRDGRAAGDYRLRLSLLLGSHRGRMAWPDRRTSQRLQAPRRRLRHCPVRPAPGSPDASQGGREGRSSWLRTMYARRVDSPTDAAAS